MRVISGPRVRLVVLLAGAALAMSGCTRLRGHQGYVLDPDLVNSVQTGVDNRNSVARVLGQPTFTSQFGESEWYYVSRDTRYFAYNRPRAVSETVLRIRFDDKGVVRTVDRTGIEQVAKITPFRKTTPTLGRQRSFFKDLFGNIGAVGAPIGGGPQQGGGRNGP